MTGAAKLPDFFGLVSAAEGDMRRVYDHAFLIHDHLSHAGTLTEEEQGALVWPAGDLLKAGWNLREHCDAMYEAARLYRAADRPKPPSVAAAIDPSKLSIEQMFALFNALGTVGDVMDGLLCQPRFQRKHDLNTAGEMLDQLRETISDARAAIRLEVVSRQPSTRSDAAIRVFFLAEEWTDGSCEPGPAIEGLTAALGGMGKAVAK